MKQRRVHIRVAGRALIVLGLMLAMSAAAARAERYGDITVTTQSHAGGETDHGYAEYTYNVTNDSKTAAHQVMLWMEHRGGSASDHIYRISQSIRVEPGAKGQIQLLQPPLPMYSSSVGVAIDGTEQRRQLVSGSVEHMQRFMWGGAGGGGTSDIAVMHTRSVNQSNLRSRIDAEFGTPSTGGWSPAERQYVQNELPVDAWPQSWLAYSRFDVIAVTGDDMRRMPAAVRDAIVSYVQIGGTLAVFGPWEAPVSWQRTTGASQNYSVGFGRVIEIETSDMSQWTTTQVRTFGNEAAQTSKPFDHRLSVKAANNAFSVVDNLGVPVRGLFGLMLVFAVLIGPVNLVLLSKKKRRMWLLWTVPAISLAACGAVFTYNIFAEGWTVHSRTQTFTILDQNTHRAATIGWCAFYAPLAPGDGLHFSRQTELNPQVQTHRYTGSGNARSVDWTRDQHLASGWITSRVPAHFKLRKVDVERRRVDIAQLSDGHFTATNGLAVDIREFYYAAEDGTLYHAADIPAGEKVTLEIEASHPKVGTPPADALRRLYSDDWLNAVKVERIRDDIHRDRLLRRGDYVAILESTPFLEDALPGAVARPEPSVLYGITTVVRP
ncbi:hypothetical protein HED60_02850 [Planctomycetales bacterium ZRK34]|nr:hypothetical protein HED60_02850 [Planctomycetales bacterium ZRK34]